MKNLALTLIIFLVACSKPIIKTTQIQPDARICTFPYSRTIAPEWICGQPTAEYAKSAVGVAEVDDGGIEYRTYLAVSNAKSRLANDMRIRVTKTSKIYLSSTIIGGEEVIRAATVTILDNITTLSLEPAKTLRVKIGPNGRVFALLAISEQQNYQIIETAVRAAIRLNQALWQQFKLDKSFSNIAKSIADMG